MARVEKDRATGCWVFMGARQKRGYGMIGVATGRCRLAHRISYELFVGPIPPDKELHHTCANRPCVNPAHLQPVVRFAHIHMEPRSMANRTHCKNGHPLSGNNLDRYGLRRGVRQCVICKRGAARADYARRKEAKRDYAAANRARINAGARRRYAADPTRFIDYQREWKAKKKHKSS